ncbi:hypothetical protein Mag101_17510 [Microbulbifer agarilyticus]|uniref:Lipoprotein n=1 Tax=Microbulbifer agarilyticus TaxID=260552 RepID=A0A1Q2M997_9GAMM|nr:hypothetical protein [Microbulbifer agarilyticus]AQQ69230.1 hypothetical protein Mag101_17510 [Microbulbifer agarilyticus]
MKCKLLAILAFGVVFLSGCAGAPQMPVSPDTVFWQESSKRIGVVVSDVPEPNVYLPGASCLLCLAAAEVANSSLSKHTDTLSTDDAKTLKTDLQTLLEANNVEVVEISEPVLFNKLPKFKSEVPNTAKRDFTGFKEQYNISHLLVMNVHAVGMHRSYSSYIPTSDPKGYFSGLGYLVDLSDNTYKWYKPVTVTKAVTEEWDEAPTFPALTNAYYQAIAEGKEIIMSSLDSKTAEN